MTSRQISSVMSFLNGEEDTPLPELNSENKALLEKIIEKRKQNLELDEKLERIKDQRKWNAEVTKSQKETLKSLEALYSAAVKEEEMVKHETVLAEREGGRLDQEIRKMNDQLKLFGEKRKTIEKDILRTQQKLELFKNQMNWDQQTMDAFQEESLCKDENTMAIVKYAQQDEQRIKSLTMAIEKKTVEAFEKCKALDKELTEKRSTEIALDTATKNLSQIHQEIQQLTQQWDITVRMMWKKDEAMQHMALKLSEKHQQAAENETMITDKKTLLNLLLNKNKETEMAVMMAKNPALQLKKDLAEHESNCSRLKEELTLCKNTLEKTTSDMNAATSHKSKLKKELGDMNQKLNTIKADNVVLREKLKMATATALGEEEQASMMNQFQKEEEQQIKLLDAQQHRKNEELYHLKQQLVSLRTEEKNALTQITRTKCTMVTRENEQRNLEQALNSKQLILAKLDDAISIQTNKLKMLQGKLKPEEMKILNEKLSELKLTLEEKRKDAASLSSMLKKQEDDICSFKKKLEKSKDQKGNLEEKVKNLKTSNKTSEKALEVLRSQKQDALVKQSDLKMEIKRRRSLLYNKTDTLMSLEKQRIEFQRLTKEREEEISVSKKVIQQELKDIEKERHKLRVELNNQFSQIEFKRKHFDDLTVSTAGPDDEEQGSQAYYITKVAQEKEELKLKRDSLVAKVQKTESENRALAKTVDKLNQSNSSFRDYLNNRFHGSSPELQEQQNLQGQLKTLEATLRKKNIVVAELQQGLKDKNVTLEDLRLKEDSERKSIQDKLKVINKMNGDVAAQQEKLNRATKQCSKLQRQIRSAKQTQSETFEEKDIRLGELRDFKRSLDKMLIEAMEGRSDLAEALATYFEEANLTLPSRATPSSSSKNSACSTPQ